MSAVVPSVFSDGHLDLEAVGDTADYLIRTGVRALAALGVASEPWALDDSQRREVVHEVVRRADGVSVAVGVDGELEEAVATAEMAAREGATHLMVRLPAGTRSGDRAREHLERLAEASGLPLMLQDVPQVSSGGLEVAAIRELVASVGALVAIKLEATDSGPVVSELAPLSVPVIVGWGGVNLPDRLLRGAQGCMPGAGTAPVFVEIVRWWKHDRVAAEATYRRLLPLLSYAGQSLDLMIAANKRTLVRLGVISSADTVPLRGSPDELQLSTVDALIQELVLQGLLNPI